MKLTKVFDKSTEVTETFMKVSPRFKRILDLVVATSSIVTIHFLSDAITSTTSSPKAADTTTKNKKKMIKYVKENIS